MPLHEMLKLKNIVSGEKSLVQAIHFHFSPFLKEISDFVRHSNGPLRRGLV